MGLFQWRSQNCHFECWKTWTRSHHLQITSQPASKVHIYGAPQPVSVNWRSVRDSIDRWGEQEGQNSKWKLLELQLHCVVRSKRQFNDPGTSPRDNLPINIAITVHAVRASKSTRKIFTFAAATSCSSDHYYIFSPLICSFQFTILIGKMWVTWRASESQNKYKTTDVIPLRRRRRVQSDRRREFTTPRPHGSRLSMLYYECLANLNFAQMRKICKQDIHRIDNIRKIEKLRLVLLQNSRGHFHFHTEIIVDLFLRGTCTGFAFFFADIRSILSHYVTHLHNSQWSCALLIDHNKCTCSGSPPLQTHNFTVSSWQDRSHTDSITSSIDQIRLDGFGFLVNSYPTVFACCSRLRSLWLYSIVLVLYTG